VLWGLLANLKLYIWVSKTECDQWLGGVGQWFARWIAVTFKFWILTNFNSNSIKLRIFYFWILKTELSMQSPIYFLIFFSFSIVLSPIYKIIISISHYQKTILTQKKFFFCFIWITRPNTYFCHLCRKQLCSNVTVFKFMVKFSNLKITNYMDNFVKLMNNVANYVMNSILSKAYY